jgi:hypothetical protein
MINSQDDSETLLEQIASETPQKLICTEAGTVLQDYISAYIAQYGFTNKKATGGTYLSCLLYSIVERIKKNKTTIN